jgi:hypothetical protein
MALQFTNTEGWLEVKAFESLLDFGYFGSATEH